MRSLRRFILVIALVAVTVFSITTVFHNNAPNQTQSEPEPPKLIRNVSIQPLPFYWKQTEEGCPELVHLVGDTRKEPTESSNGSFKPQNSQPTHLIDAIKEPRLLSSFNFSNCRMSNCFDLSRCQTDGPVKIHILPSYPSNSRALEVNESTLGESNIIHRNILKVIRNSQHYEPDPEQACLFVLEDDTLDRDPLSKSFKHDISSILQDSNMYGMNHLVFNLYSGSWPDYRENDFSGLQFGAAIVAKASNSISHHRKHFDISLPLFSYLKPYSDTLEVTSSSFEGTCDRNCSFFLTFKGKRYVFGRGSDTRNSIYHIDNNRDVVMLTTCRHGKKWKNSSDKRCPNDELNYEKYDFVELMKNSSFCLVPRGRRLGSFRFIEALSYGCIPVVLSDGWVQPFDELINWSCSIIQLPESLVLHTPDLLRDLDSDTISRLKQSCRTIYKQYFSSIEKIILTTISIVQKRVSLMKTLSTTPDLNAKDSR